MIFFDPVNNFLEINMCSQFIKAIWHYDIFLPFLDRKVSRLPAFNIRTD